MITSPPRWGGRGKGSSGRERRECWSLCQLQAAEVQSHAKFEFQEICSTAAGVSGPPNP